MMYVPAWMVVLLGPVIGSWLGVLIRRWPQGRPVGVARSACDACGQRLAPIDLVPVVSFIALRGSCRYCRAPIGRFHLLIELAALLVALVALTAGGGGAALWVNAGLGWILLLAAWIDAETMRLPDILTLPLVLAGLAVTWCFTPWALYNHAAAAALGYLGFRALNETYRAIRHRDGLGEGDAKLLAAAGAWLGVAVLPYVIVSAGVIGIVVAVLRYRLVNAPVNRPIAFGPALAVAFFGWRLAAP
jgi:leader peptidase (prepilin peptidase)/N-methyltransferase